MTHPNLYTRLARRLSRLRNQCLHLAFRFDPWHIGNGPANRLYKAEIARRANNLLPVLGTVADIGCGLGDILRNIKARRRIGCDIDAAVISAARILAVGRGIDFRVGDASAIDDYDIDIIIMVNWIHNLCPEDFEALLTQFSGRAKYLIFDTIDTDSLLKYKYSHSLGNFVGLGKLESSFRCENEPRTFHIWRMTEQPSMTLKKNI